MNELYIVLILTVLFFYSSQKFLFYLINDKQIFFDNEYDKPQAFHNNKVTKVGGGIFIFLPIYFLILDNYFNFQPYLFKIFLTPLILLVIGLLSDLKVLESAKFRLALIIFATLFIVYVCKINIDFLKFNHGVFFYILQLFFISFVIISIINGSNFVDGLNGLLLSLTSIIFFFFIIIDVNYNNSEYFYFIIFF